MFLKPTAKPTPRRTPSPRVVLPAPPGQADRIARAAPPARAARARRRGGSPRRSAASPSITWPVGSVSPGCERVQQPQLDRVDPERGGELVHLRLARRSRSARRRSRASRRTAGCSCRRTVDSISAFGDVVRARRRTRPRSSVTAVELEA